ncbi:hypothetical protein [Cylindrospermopsis raciborskii]
MRLIGSIIVVYLHENRCNITLPTGDCAALPTGDHSPLGTFYVSRKGRR